MLTRAPFRLVACTTLAQQLMQLIGNCSLCQFVYYGSVVFHSMEEEKVQCNGMLILNS